MGGALFCVGGGSSDFPTAVSVDPSETIMAFSFVAAARMLERW